MSDYEWHRLDEQVTHCNSRTDYEIINHKFSPGSCEECARIRDMGYDETPTKGL